MRDESTDWHLDKRVPISLILAIAMQTIAIVWWVATANARIDQLERQGSATPVQNERIIRLESKVDAIQETLVELKSFLRK